jgi:hypothetical protein
MNFMWRSDKKRGGEESGVRSQESESQAKACATHESGAWFGSEALPGVRYKVARVSISRRIELARAIREIGRKLEFLEAGSDPREKIEAAVLEAEIDQAYLEWGLAEITGLSIDGDGATPRALIDRGPMALAMEILARIKAECGLSEGERKN